MTPTSSKNKRCTQRGLTLLELLIALTLLSLIAVMTAGKAGRSSPRLTVKFASEQLLADIKFARLRSQTSNSIIAIDFNEKGYAIPSLNVERAFPAGLTASLMGGDNTQVIFGPGFRTSAYDVTLSKGEAAAVVRIDAVTRRITLQ